MSQQQLPQPAQMFYRKVGEQAYEHLDPSLQYNITLKDCGYDLPGPHDIWVAVDMSVLYGLSGGEPPPPPPSKRGNRLLSSQPFSRRLFALRILHHRCPRNLPHQHFPRFINE